VEGKHYALTFRVQNSSLGEIEEGVKVHPAGREIEDFLLDGTGLPSGDLKEQGEQVTFVGRWPGSLGMVDQDILGRK